MQVKKYTCRNVQGPNKNTEIKYLRTVMAEQRKIVIPGILLFETTADVHFKNIF